VEHSLTTVCFLKNYFFKLSKEFIDKINFTVFIDCFVHSSQDIYPAAVLIA